MSEIKIYIGIDPDSVKSGVATYDIDDKHLDFELLSFWDLIDELDSYLVPIHVVLEAGHLIKKSNWHGAKNVFTAAKIGKNVGNNHQVGKLLEEYLIKKNISYELKKPIGKMNAEDFNRYWGWKTRTNQEVRDAAMLIFKYKK